MRSRTTRQGPGLFARSRASLTIEAEAADGSSRPMKRRITFVPRELKRETIPVITSLEPSPGSEQIPSMHGRPEAQNEERTRTPQRAEEGSTGLSTEKGGQIEPEWAEETTAGMAIRHPS